jgi:MarR family
MSSDDHPIYSRPGHLIRRLQQIAVAIFMGETKRFNITPVQYSALLAIEMHPDIDQTTLVNIITFDRSTIGNVVGRLEGKKWIKRTADSRDPHEAAHDHATGPQGPARDKFIGGIGAEADPHPAATCRAHGVYGHAEASCADQQRSEPCAYANATAQPPEEEPCGPTLTYR